MLRFTTAGESHGPALVSVLEGMPAGLPLLAEHVDVELSRRQQGYGRGRRMQIVRDTVEFLSGVRAGQTVGSPIAMLIANRDWKNWQDVMDPAPREGDPDPRRRAVTRVRPGHADLTGILKYDRDDARDSLERASARETTARGALSYVSDQLAADLATPAAELIGRPFNDLIGSDSSGTADSSERTLGFHLSARLPFADITVRANTSAETWWSLSGTPSFDEYGRFLGFRGIGADLTQQRRSEEEINRLAQERLAVVLVSSELPEVLGLSDRVLVLHEGRVTGEFKREEATPEAVMACATGHTQRAA
jgi:hypothetical protein